MKKLSLFLVILLISIAHFSVADGGCSGASKIVVVTAADLEPIATIPYVGQFIASNPGIDINIAHDQALRLTFWTYGPACTQNINSVLEVNGVVQPVTSPILITTSGTYKLTIPADIIPQVWTWHVTVDPPPDGSNEEIDVTGTIDVPEPAERIEPLFQVSPDNLTLEYFSASDATLTIDINALNGRIGSTHVVNIHKGRHRYHIPLLQIASGIYLVILRQEDHRQTFKVFCP